MKPIPAGMRESLPGRTPAASGRTWLAGYRRMPLWIARWPFADLTEQQLMERARFEAAMRSELLRGLPSAFGQLG
jgi:hypothetical protein